MGRRAGRREDRRLAGRREGGWLASVIYLVLPRRGLWRVTVSAPVVATSSSHRATMHGATQAFRRAMAIGAAKSVSFAGKKTQTVLDLKLV